MAQLPTCLSIVGAGALGQAFAALLAANGQPVTLLATPTSTDRLLSSGAIRLAGVVTHEVAVAPAPAPAGTVGVTADPAKLPASTGLIFATKGHHLASVIRDVHAVWPQAHDTVSWVAGVQNGIIKDDLLAETFGQERVIGAVTIFSAQRDASGTVIVTSPGGTYFGELAGGTSPRVEHATTTLRQAGIPTESVTDIQSVLWTKACNAAGVFGVTVLARTSGARMGGRPSLVRAYLGLIRETAAIANVYGVSIGDYAGFPIRTYLEQPEAETLAQFAARAESARANPAAIENLPSMVQDLLAGRPLEVNEIFGDLVTRAERAGVDTPRLALVRDLIQGIDPGQHGG